jgi:hypothetical protein
MERHLQERTITPPHGREAGSYTKILEYDGGLEPLQGCQKERFGFEQSVLDLPVKQTKEQKFQKDKQHQKLD